MRQLIVALAICAYPGVLYLIYLTIDLWRNREQRVREEAKL